MNFEATKIHIQYLAGRAPSSDWSVNSFKMVWAKITSAMFMLLAIGHLSKTNYANCFYLQ